jgi:hypothetical protein
MRSLGCSPADPGLKHRVYPSHYIRAVAHGFEALVAVLKGLPARRDKCPMRRDRIDRVCTCYFRWAPNGPIEVTQSGTSLTTARRVNTGLYRFVRSGSTAITGLKIRCVK